MDEYNRSGYKRKAVAEQAMLMLPLNVIMTASIRGYVDGKKLSDVLNRLRKRHALLAVRVVIDEDKRAWFITDGVPGFNLEVIPRNNENQWIERAQEELKIPFPLEKGPLARFTLLYSPGVSELIICMHHVVCDGISLTYLIKDILQYLSEPERDVEILPDPPIVDSTTVTSPPKIKPIVRKIVKLINKRWEKKNIRFDYDDDRKRLHKIFWERNENAKLLTWTITKEMTRELILRCRLRKVTVNTALWTALLAAQFDVQSPLKPYHKQAGIAVNIRDKLLMPVGESFGFYAASLPVRLKYTPKKDFWENAKNIHHSIRTKLRKTELFRSLITELLDPGFFDSLFFSKYGLIKNRMSAIFMKLMKWDRMNYGCVMTNVGRMNIPSVYGSLLLDSVYGPCVYSDVNEKIIGVITIGDKISFIMTYNEDNITSDEAKRIRDRAMEYLSRATGVK